MAKQGVALTIKINAMYNCLVNIPTLIAMHSEKGKKITTRMKERIIRQYPQHPMSPSRSVSIKQ